MNDTFYTFYQAAMTASLAVSAAVLVLGVYFRKRPGTTMMAVLAVGTFVWALGGFLESHAAPPRRQLLFTEIGYIGMVTVPVAWVSFAAR